jgi:ribose 5-phosphate isomerase B
MTIYLAADHAGFELKEKIKTFLEKAGYKVKDFGAFTLDADDDYPDYVKKAARAVQKNPDSDKAIVFGASGQGEAMVANRHKKVRAAVYYSAVPKAITLSREHNDANILSIGARFIAESDAKRAIALWLKTPFSRKARHARRIEKF